MPLRALEMTQDSFAAPPVGSGHLKRLSVDSVESSGACALFGVFQVGTICTRIYAHMFPLVFVRNTNRPEGP
jgi:hypothetical protein